MKHTIYIQNYFPSVISTRKAIKNLSDNIMLNTEDDYLFDFSEIAFISRSFADEFVKFLKESEIKWQIHNDNSNIKAMLDVVNRTSISSRSDFDHVAVTTFRSKNELSMFLATF